MIWIQQTKKRREIDSTKMKKKINRENIHLALCIFLDSIFIIYSIFALVLNGEKIARYQFSTPYYKCSNGINIFLLLRLWFDFFSFFFLVNRKKWICWMSSLRKRIFQFIENSKSNNNKIMRCIGIENRKTHDIK